MEQWHAPVQQTETPQEQVITLSSDDRTWGMLAHLGAFAGMIFPLIGNILGPLIIWLVKKEESSFVNDQGKEALNFQITIAAIGIVLGIISGIFGFILTLIFPIAGLLVLILVSLIPIALGICAMVFMIIAAVKANKGEYYRYPFAIRLIK
ncbi:DUF4870 domain-containing protein [Desmospora activa]|uniref:Tic20 family protein n=1 Tax=Desmospora activa DSM 45169 TaxID=1121389 RepID=A0A2T4Z9A1_9BACL|nr:DUF4870 domain-containing protein [Desmospora activa]PTM58474.1 hypothetical protein C8J48_1057 [Desmospora activa DSM 45169]